MRTKLVGILNITPDSFSDGGKYNIGELAVNHTKKMIEAGASVIDIGAESTRPGSIPITAEEEWQRLAKILPEIVFEIKKHPDIEISIDSYHFETIKKSYEIGIDIVNDVSGLVDEKIIEFVADKGIKTILMHNLAIHSDPGLIINPDLNINNEIISWAQAKVAHLLKKGIKKSQLIFDPGIGFAKSSQQSIRILKNVDSYRRLDLPLYIGHSKKRFLDELDIEGDRAARTLEVSKFLIEKNVEFLRIHDVELHAQLFNSA